MESTMTFADLKSRTEDLLDIDDLSSDLNTKTVTIAVSDFLALYIQEEMLRYPEKHQSVAQMVPNIGGVNQIPLSSISEDLYGTKLGFHVREGGEQGRQLFEVRDGSKYRGYIIRDGVLKLYGFGDTQYPGELWFGYSPDLPSYDFQNADQYFNADNPTLVPIQKGVEEAAEFYVAYRYTERDQGDPSKAINYRNSALRKIQEFFTLNRKVVKL